MSFFKKLLKVIAIIIAIIAIILIIYVLLMMIFAAGITLTVGAIPLGVAGLQATAIQLLIVAAIGLGLSAAISPEGFKKVANRAKSAARQVTTFMAEVTREGVAGIFDGIFGKGSTKWLALFGVTAVGLLIYLNYDSESGKPKLVKEVEPKLLADGRQTGSSTVVEVPTSTSTRNGRAQLVNIGRG